MTETFSRQNFVRRYNQFFPTIVAISIIISLSSSPLVAGERSVGMSTSFTLKVAGLKIARVNMGSIWEAGTYLVRMEAKRSQLGYLVNFGGATTSTGAITGGRAVPQNFAVDYQVQSKRQLITLAFDGDGVNDINVDPPQNAMNERVPVLDEHRRGVYDPVSAFLFPLADGELTGKSACNRNIPIFDGRYRFDITLKHIRTVKLPSHERPGEQTDVFICGMKYTPVAGHKENKDSKIYQWANRDGVEVWLMPLRRMGVLLPIKGVFPTPVGTAVFMMDRLEMAGQVQHASTN